MWINQSTKNGVLPGRPCSPISGLTSENNSKPCDNLHATPMMTCVTLVNLNHKESHASVWAERCCPDAIVAHLVSVALQPRWPEPVANIAAKDVTNLERRSWIWVGGRLVESTQTSSGLFSSQSVAKGKLAKTRNKGTYLGVSGWNKHQTNQTSETWQGFAHSAERNSE